MSYLPGPFAPFELGREARQQAQQPPPAQWQQQGYAPVYGGPVPAQVPQTPMGAGPAGAMPPQIVTPYKPRVRRAPSSSPGWGTPGGLPGVGGGSRPGTPLRSQSPLPALGPALQASLAPGQGVSRTPTPALDIQAMEAEIDAAHARAADAARDTLAQIFPTIDEEVRMMVLEANEGDLGRSIEALLEMSGGG
jgi:Rab5 GDP/GTP exchange factor